MANKLVFNNLILHPAQQTVYKAVVSAIMDFNEALQQKRTKTLIKSINIELLEDFYCDFAGDVNKKANKGYLNYSVFVYYANLYVEKSMSHIAKEDILLQKTKDLLTKREDSIFAIEKSLNGDIQKISDFFKYVEKNGVNNGLRRNNESIFNSDEIYVINEIGVRHFFSDKSEFKLEDTVKIYFAQHMVMSSLEDVKLLSN